MSEALKELVNGYGGLHGPVWMVLLGEAFDPIKMEETFNRELAYLTRYGRFDPGWLFQQTRKQIRQLIESVAHWMEEESVLQHAGER